MNEKALSIFSYIVIVAVAVAVCAGFSWFRKRKADRDSERARELNDRAGTDNQRLADKERETRELIEKSRAELERADELIQGQADDYRRAEKNNIRAKELSREAKDILDNNSDK